MFRRSLPIALLLLCSFVAACGKDSPTGPSENPPATQTRIIALSGDLNFGPVEVGGRSERLFRVHNNGTAPLNITGMTSSNASNFPVSWTNGVVAPGTYQDVTVRFQPTEAKSYDTTLRVNGNQTEGTNGIVITASGVRTGPLWEGWGTGPYVFDMPPSVSRVRITATYAGFCENFIVRVAGRGVVNEILGTCSVADSVNYDGTHLVTGGGTVEVREASGISWRMVEVR